MNLLDRFGQQPFSGVQVAAYREARALLGEMLERERSVLASE